MKQEFDMMEPLMEFFGGRDAKVLEYWYDNSMFSGWKKPPKEFILQEESMQKDIQTYHKMGFDCISTFACYLGAEYEALYGEPDISPFAEDVKKYSRS